MAIETIVSVNIIGKISSLDNALIKIAKSEMLHLEHIDKKSKIKKIFNELNEKNPYSEMLEKIKKIFKILKITPRFNDYSSISFRKMNELNDIINNAFNKIKEKTQTIRSLKTKVSLMEKSIQQLNHLKSFDSKLYKIFYANFISSCFGKIPINDYLKLNHFNNINFFFIPLEKDDNFYWGLFIYPKIEENKFQEVKKSVFFEQYYSSEQIEKNPKLTIKTLENEIEILKNKIDALKLEIENYKAQYGQNFLCIYSKIKTLYTTFNYRRFAVSNNNIFYINGFVLKKDIYEFSKLFDEINDVVVEVISQKNRKQKNSNIPVKLKTNVLFKPFELIIETFGLPSYETANPTSFIGFIYCFLFGLMFGDVGQGACLFFAGIVLWIWKKSVLGLILTRCSIFSCIFGLIYDSCFGFEGLFKNFWGAIKIFPNFPFSLLKGKNAVNILIFSLILGMILINSAILTNILTNLKNRKYKQTIFSGNGLIGFIIYGNITAIAVSLLIFKTNILNQTFFILAILVPIILIFLEQPILNLINKTFFKEERTSKFDFLNSTLETFETILNYFTNTLSFLRVGGFAMSHAALMLVVVKFCEKCSNIVASPLIAILGNIFVIALEGMVVSIQILRLVYYEIFSRFYKSDGKKFEPAKIIF